MRFVRSWFHAFEIDFFRPSLSGGKSVFLKSRREHNVNTLSDDTWESKWLQSVRCDHPHNNRRVNTLRFLQTDARSVWLFAPIIIGCGNGLKMRGYNMRNGDQAVGVVRITWTQCFANGRIGLSSSNALL